MTQKAWNLQYQEGTATRCCAYCDHRQQVPAHWCEEVCMEIALNMNCISFDNRKYAAYMEKQGTKGT